MDKNNFFAILGSPGKGNSKPKKKNGRRKYSQKREVVEKPSVEEPVVNAVGSQAMEENGFVRVKKRRKYDKKIDQSKVGKFEKASLFNHLLEQKDSSRMEQKDSSRMEQKDSSRMEQKDSSRMEQKDSPTMKNSKRPQDIHVDTKDHQFDTEKTPPTPQHLFDNITSTPVLIHSLQEVAQRSTTNRFLLLKEWNVLLQDKRPKYRDENCTITFREAFLKSRTIEMIVGSFLRHPNTSDESQLWELFRQTMIGDDAFHYNLIAKLKDMSYFLQKLPHHRAEKLIQRIGKIINVLKIKPQMESSKLKRIDYFDRKIYITKLEIKGSDQKAATQKTGDLIVLLSQKQQLLMSLMDKEINSNENEELFFSVGTPTPTTEETLQMKQHDKDIEKCYQKIQEYENELEQNKSFAASIQEKINALQEKLNSIQSTIVNLENNIKKEESDILSIQSKKNNHSNFDSIHENPEKVLQTMLGELQQWSYEAISTEQATQKENFQSWINCGIDDLNTYIRNFYETHNSFLVKNLNRSLRKLQSPSHKKDNFKQLRHYQTCQRIISDIERIEHLLPTSYVHEIIPEMPEYKEKMIQFRTIMKSVDEELSKRKQ